VSWSLILHAHIISRCFPVTMRLVPSLLPDGASTTLYTFQTLGRAVLGQQNSKLGVLL